MLNKVTWDGYVGISNSLCEQPIRLTYDRGCLELMTLSREHELLKALLRRFLEAIAEECGMEFSTGGSMTFRRQELDRGLEPDECYWIEHEAAIRDKREVDLAIDPPPDLVVEIEVSRGVLDRLGIYAAMSVPEVWRYDGATLGALLLGSDGLYTTGQSSRAFPFLDLADLLPFLQQRGRLGEAAISKNFRAWAREQVATGRWKISGQP